MTTQLAVLAASELCGSVEDFGHTRWDRQRCRGGGSTMLVQMLLGLQAVQCGRFGGGCWLRLLAEKWPHHVTIETSDSRGGSGSEASMHHSGGKQGQRAPVRTFARCRSGLADLRARM